MDSFPTLESPRLLLREIVAADADAIFTIRSDYEVTRHNIGPAYTHIAQAKELIAGIAQDCAAGIPRWGITLKPAPIVVGMIGFNRIEAFDRRASVGFDLARAYWNQGIMTEALRLVLDYAFGQRTLNRVEADTSEHNAASQQVLRKLGFRQEGRLREHFYEDGRYHDLLVWGLLRREHVGGTGRH